MGGELGIFSSPWASILHTTTRTSLRSVLRPQPVFEGSGVKGELGIFLDFGSLYRERNPNFS